VVLTNAYGNSTLVNGFAYGSVPVLSAVNPRLGAPSAALPGVTLTGVNFQAAGAGTPTVTVGGTAAGAVTVVNDTTVTATFPAKAAGAYNVALTNAYGSSTLVNGFAYGLAPLLTTVSPTTGTIDTASTGVSLTGSRFASAGAGTTTITVGGTAAGAVTVVNDTTVTATFPAMAAGTYDVVIANNFGSAALTSAFTYSSPASPAADTGGGPCFIATAAYGSPMHPYVNILREFREAYLRPTVLGRLFIQGYERHSPAFAEAIADRPLLKAPVRALLWPLVGAAFVLVHAGPLASVTGLAGILGILGVGIRRRRTRR
jgi:hypothetical protein